MTAVAAAVGPATGAGSTVRVGDDSFKARKGTFRYLCTLHVDKGMRGVVIVR